MTFEELLHQTGAYWASRTILTAVELDLFTHIHRGSTTIETLALTSGTSERGLRIILPALTALDLVEEGDGGIRLTPLGKLLSTQNPHHRLGIFWHHANLWNKWNALTQAVASGHGTRGTLDLESFILAMAHGKTHPYGDYFNGLDLTNVKSVLDLGGGPGSFALAFLDVLPKADVVLFDYPEVITLAEKILPREVLNSGRLTLRRGDFSRDSLGKHYDLVWISSIIHSYSPEDNRELVKRCRKSLNHSGRIVIKDFFLDSDRKGPLYPTLFGLNMLVNTPDGRAYTLEETRGWMEEAGLKEIQILPSVGDARIVVGTRP